MSPEPRHLLLFGQPEPLAEQIELRAGPIRLLFEDGSIRYARYKGREILRRIYASVRDHEWRTVPGVTREVQISRRADSFELTFVSEHNAWGIHFIWSGRIVGDSRGKITFEFEGEAKSAFQRNRIGFCVLHAPDSVVGAKCELTHTSGAIAQAGFPRTIAPVQPLPEFRDLTGIRYEIMPGTWVATEFEGDVFETEDQRNWLDNSFKTYCTPVSLPTPVLIGPGDRVRQKVTLRLEGAVENKTVSAPSHAVEIEIGAKACALPKIGFAAPLSGEGLTFSACARNQQLRPAHLRVEVKMNEPDWQQRFIAGFRAATALKCKVEFALRLTGWAGDDLKDLLTTFPEPFQHWAFSSSFARILVSTFGEPSTSKRSFESLRAFLARTGLASLDVPIGAGTEGDLYDLNLQRPPGNADLFFWSMNPQVHAAEIASISETPSGARQQIESVQEYFGDAPKVISPITLRPRSIILPGLDEPSSRRDPRQKSLFAAAWTIGMLEGLTSGGAASATFFETAGPLGIMENGGPVFPMYHVFRAVADAETAVPCSASDPLSVGAFAVKVGGNIRLLIGNYRPEQVTVRAPTTGPVTVRRLNEETARTALADPDSLWNAKPGTTTDPSLNLAPFEIAFVDFGQPSLPEAF